MNMGERIREARKSAKMTQSELATITGLSVNTISRYENGDRKPTLDIMLSIASALNITPFDFFKGATIDLSEDTHVKETIHKRIILDAFEKLNGTGKRIAAQRVQELTEIERYTRPEQDTEPQAEEEKPQEHPQK